MVSAVRDGARRRKVALASVVCAAFVLPSCSSPTAPTTARVAVMAVSPSRGSTTGGTEVQITGSGFAAGATVSIGGMPATGVVVQSSTSLTAVTQPRSGPGSSDVSVTAGGSTAQLAGAFTYVAP